jgi:hypothetical protein
MQLVKDEPVVKDEPLVNDEPERPNRHRCGGATRTQLDATEAEDPPRDI